MTLAYDAGREAAAVPDRLGADTLSAFELCRDTDLGVVTRTLEDVSACSGSWELLSPGAEPEPSVVRAVELTHLTLCSVQFGTEVRIVIDPIQAYHVTVPITGQVLCHFGSRDVTVGPGLASAVTTGNPAFMPHWSAGAEVLCIKIRQDALESELAAMIGRPVRPPVRLGIGLGLTTPAGQSWLSVLGLLLNDLATPDSLSRTSKHHREQLERLVISTLLRAQSHDYSDDVWSGQAPARWSSVKRAVEAIDDAPELAWTLTWLAEVAGVSGRRLQQGFHAQLGMSPMKYLQNVRLERVHRDLLNDAGPVGDLCTRWGFTHLGRFAGAYRERYGESPSQTRRRSRSVPV
ncbi:AraC family transcriptional regulator [Streptomyces hokutonensis]|uniref:AraC family transcriptional regulator n=1 Tax=Streptomyces hokutonensis TaxID=1306990 RepID=UPI0036BF8693